MRAFALALVLSTVFIVTLPRLPSTTICIVFLVALLLIALFVRRSRPWIAGVLVAIATLTASFLQLASHQLTADQVSTDLQLKVRITGVPERSGRRLAFNARVLSCGSCAKDLRIQRLRLSWYGNSPNVNAGETWQLTARLKPPASLRNPGSFDAVAWSLVKGLHAKGYVRAATPAVRLAESSRFSLSSFRQRAALQLQNLLDDDEHLGLLQALTVGLKTQISDDQWALLRNTGTAHLLAISGLHVGLVAGWVLVSGRLIIISIMRLGQRYTERPFILDGRPFVITSSIVAAAAYAALAGFELPTQRAVLMLCVWAVAALQFRFLPPFAALCIALICVLLSNPLNPLSAGFWLSFGTVALLFYLHRGYLGQHSVADTGRWRTLAHKLQSGTRTHVLLGVALLPVTAWFFQSGSLVAPVANLLAVPWVAVVSVPLSLLALISSAFSHTLASVLLSLAEHSLRVLLQFLSVLDSSKISSVVLSLPGTTAFILALIALLALLSPRGLRLRMLAMPLLIPALLFNTKSPDVQGFEVHVLDVGQGLAVVVFAGSQTLLFDTGGKVSPHLSMFEAVVVPFLHASGRRRIDTLVVSHGDEDHAFGVADVVRRYPDVDIFSSQHLDSLTGHDVTRCAAGQLSSLGSAQLAFVHPAVNDVGSDNDLSCVLLIYAAGSRVLLTGDIEASGERRLLARLGETGEFPVTLLTAPHHGSLSSSTQEFVARLRPDYVVFAAGNRNRYRFPHREVQLRYKLAGSKPFITGRRGSISFVFGDNGLTRPPSSWWDSHRRFWHGIVNPDCWQYFAGESLARRLLALSQKGQLLCGK